VNGGSWEWSAKVMHFYHERLNDVVLLLLSLSSQELQQQQNNFQGVEV
jgi:hypothetical protein